MSKRSYGQGVASITSTGGPELRFLLNPSAVQWGFEVNTAVFDTVGGRVVQVLGASVSDLIVSGTIGMSSSQQDAWRQAEGFMSRIKDLVEWQSRDATIAGRRMQPPLIFSFPQKNWLFEVYIKAATDPEGAGIATHSSGKFSYDYQITMSVLNDLRNTSRIVGSANGDLKITKEKAVSDYINSIANGIDWKISKYNGDYEGTGTFVTTGFETGQGPATVAVGNMAPVADTSATGDSGAS